MKNPFLIGEKVYLRPLELEDAPAMVGWINDPEVTRTLMIRRPMNQIAEREFIERISKGDSAQVLGIVTRREDEFIGTTGLHAIDWRNRTTGFGIEIGVKSKWGVGYGTEATGLMVKHAFETLNLNRVWLHVYEYNPRGMRAYERVGFKREGVLRQANYREGRYWDTITMAILREEWEAGKAKS